MRSTPRSCITTDDITLSLSPQLGPNTQTTYGIFQFFNGMIVMESKQNDGPTPPRKQTEMRGLASKRDGQISMFDLQHRVSPYAHRPGRALAVHHLEFAAQSSQRSGSASCSEASSRTPSSPSRFDQSRWNQYAPSCEGLRARREEPCAASICGGVAGSYEIPREGASAPTSQDGTTHSTMVSIVSGQHRRRAPPCHCG